MNLENNNQQALDALVAEAYQVFGHYRAPVGTLNACTVCCMSADLALEMTRLPLKRLGRHHFYDYNTAAKEEDQPVDEILHFLPRMLDLMAQGVDIHHSLELSLDRLAGEPVQALNGAQRSLLDRFALAYFQNAVGPDAWGEDGRQLGDEPFTVLAMVQLAGLDIQPLLAWWLQSDDPRATAHFVRGCYWGVWTEADSLNAFTKDQPDFSARILRWLQDPANRARWVDKLLCPAFQRTMGQQHGSVQVPFELMVDAAFDALTQPAALHA